MSRARGIDRGGGAGPLSRPRVLHVVVGGDVGGAERLIADLAARPEASGADHAIALLSAREGLHELFRDRGLTVYARRASGEGPLAYLAQSLGRADASWLARLVEEERITILHTHTLGSHVLGTRAALRTGRPQLRTEHHVMHYEDASSAPFTRWAAARTPRFVAVSEYVRRALGRLAPEVAARCEVVRNGVDAASFVAPPRPVTAGSLVAGIVCRLAAWKRVHLAIEASARADVRLVVVGDGEERAALERRARRLRSPVVFVGHQRDPRPFVAACDVTLNTSDREPLGLSVLESLAMGRPVLAFAAGGIPEIVQDGVTGWLSEDGGARALASLLLRARRERERLAAMGAAGRAFATARADVLGMCQAYAAIYRSMRVEGDDGR